MTGGTSSVVTIAPKTILLPRNSRRASAYAPIEAVIRMSAVCMVAAARLLSNQRKIGCWPEERVWYASRLNGLGIGLPGELMAW